MAMLIIHVCKPAMYYMLPLVWTLIISVMYYVPPLIWTPITFTNLALAIAYLHHLVSIPDSSVLNAMALVFCIPGVLGMGSANGRRYNIIMPVLISWAHAQNDPCNCVVAAVDIDPHALVSVDPTTRFAWLAPHPLKLNIAPRWPRVTSGNIRGSLSKGIS